MYAVIMAGGSGTRFWPKSRNRLPKQLIGIIDSEDNTLIQLTVKRILPLIKMENIFIVTNVLHKEEIQRQLPDINENNIIAEPVGRNTAPCIGLAAIHLQRIDPEGCMIVLSADHFVKDEKMFRDVVLSACKFVSEKDCLITLGIKPARPETGYGYINIGEEIDNINGSTIYKVKKFTEKPDKETAEKFFSSSEYLWNCGIFIWKAGTIIERIKKFLPDIYGGLMDIDRYLDTTESSSIIEKVYSIIDSVSIDHGVLEKADDIAVIPCNPGWSDVGSWNTLYDLLPEDQYGNIEIGRHIKIDTHNSIINSRKRLVAAIGVNDMIIVDTDDAVLICHKDRAQEVKDIVNILRKNGLDELL